LEDYSIGQDDCVLPGPREKVIWTFKNGDMIESLEVVYADLLKAYWMFTSILKDPSG